MAVDYMNIQQDSSINPMYAEYTHDGQRMTKEESLFIYYLVAGLSKIEAFVRAGYKFPRTNPGIHEIDRGVSSVDKSEELRTKRIAKAERLKAKEKSPDGGEDEKEDTLTYLEKAIDKLPQELLTLTPFTDINSLSAKSRYLISESARDILNDPRLLPEYKFRILSLRDAQVADAHEIYAYFTAVMRGQVKDQFGLEASLQERTRAAEALARRMIDIPMKIEATQKMVEQGAVQLVIEPRKETIDANYEEVGEE